MSAAVYSVIPLLVQDQGRQMQFQLRYNPKTQSVRLEGVFFKRSIFIGRRLFNNLFQFMCNEYGYKLGRILYNTSTFKSGTATTCNNEQYHFSLKDDDGICISLQNEANNCTEVTAFVQADATVMQEGTFLKALIPAVLAVVIYAREAAGVA